MTKKPEIKKDAKSEFLTELVDRYSYWKAKKEEDFATAYERMIFAFTTPKAKEPNKE